MAPCPTSGLIIQGGADEIVAPDSVSLMAHRLNTQRNVDVDFALLEEGDHMYNGHLIDLYKVAGNYIIGAVQRKTPQKKRRGRRKKIEMEQENLMLEDNATENEDLGTDDSFVNEEAL